MSNQIDLNALRDAVLQTQAEGRMQPSDEQKTILVSKEGKMIMAGEAGDEERRTMSKVQQDTFHGRTEREALIVHDFMPSSTIPHTTPEGYQGWLYSFQCTYGITYRMFAYFDGSYYQVLVLEPKVEEKYRSAHLGHIYRNGQICFGTRYNSGRATLKQAYAKSVLWATGMSGLLLNKYQIFPMSINNLDD
ncbi:MAG: hypothetical protein WCG19_09535 [Chlorobiaceae bacterium]